ncbi:hypothetical protein [Pseudoalteromonas rubra]|uniref:Uncharacterized protein n=1 Tax=Pseudoalteromonas rubra TaxID=43658 RepID=A0A0U3HSD8_9GAMM|nr:hypothetical protein [Pseudoalteromonas rubra]ALU44249.1 hypothetical protein AT705_15580 [Pseudoalteromonas rubra]
MKHTLLVAAITVAPFAANAAKTISSGSYGHTQEQGKIAAISALERQANGNPLSNVRTSCRSTNYPLPWYCTATAQVATLSFGSDSYEMCGRSHSKSDTNARFEAAIGRKSCDSNKYSTYRSNFAVNESSFAGNACDYTSPKGRLFNSIWLLDNADKSGDNSILGWAYHETQKDVHNTHSICDEGVFARFKWEKKFYSWEWVKRSEMSFSRAGLYDQDVIGRAATLVHEARHMDKSHGNAGGACSGSSCDPNWSYNGSNTYQALWLWWFAVNANDATPAMRASAEQHANYTINRRFVTPPAYHADKDAEIINKSTASGLSRPIEPSNTVTFTAAGGVESTVRSQATSGFVNKYGKQPTKVECSHNPHNMGPPPWICVATGPK